PLAGDDQLAPASPDRLLLGIQPQGLTLGSPQPSGAQHLLQSGDRGARAPRTPVLPNVVSRVRSHCPPCCWDNHVQRAGSAYDCRCAWPCPTPASSVYFTSGFTVFHAALMSRASWTGMTLSVRP